MFVKSNQFLDEYRLKRLRPSAVSLQENGATTIKSGKNDYLQNHSPVHIYVSPNHMILAKNTKNKELKLSEGKTDHAGSGLMPVNCD
jgi:hypothetical protein